AGAQRPGKTGPLSLSTSGVGACRGQNPQSLLFCRDSRCSLISIKGAGYVGCFGRFLMNRHLECGG
ncbi:MAG: hypothetical protein ACP5GY_08110, partial [Vulcanisaeta sp.]